MQAITPFLIGIFSGFHCVAMCGGLCALICKKQNRRITLFTNFGRVFTYVILGIIFAGIIQGSSLSLNLQNHGFLIRSIMGVSLVLLGLSVMLQAKLRILYVSKGLPFWGKASNKLTQLTGQNTPASFFFKGMLWGLIPCGLLYGLLLVAASTADYLRGGLFMLFFGMGTLLPMMLSNELFIRIQNNKNIKLIRHLSASFIIFVGLWTLLGQRFSHLFIPENNTFFTGLSAVLDLCIP